MDINFKQATDFLLAHDYILAVGKGKFKLSTKFQLEYAQMGKGKADLLDYHGLPGPVTSMETPALTMADPGSRWEIAYKQLITNAQVPRRIETRRGESYPANNFSQEGLKAYRKAIEQGYDFTLMAKAVMLYYKSNITCKMAIGRFMSEGHWKTYYDDLAQAASQGVDAVNNLVTEQTKDTDVDHYELG